jgi:TldD protein
MQTGFEAPGRTVGFELFDEIEPEEVARVAARRALTMLDARPAPRGKLPVVLKRGAGGVLFHEACGHGLEADLVDKDASVFRGRVGELVASPLITLVDDGTCASGARARSTTRRARAAACSSKTVLTDYMDLVRAQEGASGGNGRRETYQHLMVRMTNTPCSTTTIPTIIRTPYGIYCVALGGGQVNTATGDFVFGITEAYMIENGEITEPCAPHSSSATAPRHCAGRRGGLDFDLGGYVWQGRPGRAGVVRAPTLRVAELTVGGTAGD